MAVKRLLLLLNGCSCILEERGNGEFEVFSAKAIYNNSDALNPLPFMQMDEIQEFDIPSSISNSNSINVIMQYVMDNFADHFYSYPKLFLSKKVEDYLIEQSVTKIVSNDFMIDVNINHVPTIKLDGSFDTMYIVGNHNFIFESWSNNFNIQTLKLKDSSLSFDCSIIKKHMKIGWLCISTVRTISNTENIIKNKHIESLTISTLRANIKQIGEIVEKHLTTHDVNAFIEEMLEKGFEDFI